MFNLVGGGAPPLLYHQKAVITSHRIFFLFFLLRMETIKDYKQAIDEICHTLWVFGYAVDAVAKPENAIIMAIKEQWKLADLEVIANRCRGYNPKNRIKEELTKDTPTKEILRQRLDYVFFELQEQPPFADGCNYFPVFDEVFFSINNKQLTEALATINGQTWAFKAASQLENIVKWANHFVSSVVAMLNSLCRFAQYDTEIDTQTTFLSTSKHNTDKLATGAETSQQKAIKQPQQPTGIVIPDWLQEYKEQLFTERANKYFPVALANGLIEQTSQGYKKHSSISKALLAYFLQRVYIVDDAVFPDTALNKLFGESNLKQAVYSLSGNKNADGKPRQYQKVDAIFDEA